MSVDLFDSHAKAARGAVLVAHGLNNKPEVMDELIHVLVTEGFHCVRVSLHNGPSDRCSPAAIAEEWVDNIAEAYAEISSHYSECRVYNLSYSLGALATIRFLQVKQSATFDKMVLLAPAVALTRRAALVRFLAPFARFGLVLPSLAPMEVRARPGTPIADYAAMLKLIETAKTLCTAPSSLDTG